MSSTEFDPEPRPKIRIFLLRSRADGTRASAPGLRRQHEGHPRSHSRVHPGGDLRRVGAAGQLPTPPLGALRRPAIVPHGASGYPV